MLSSWSLVPQSPNIIAPRHSLLTETPVRPRYRVFHVVLLELLWVRGRGCSATVFGDGVFLVGDMAAPLRPARRRRRRWTMKRSGVCQWFSRSKNTRSPGDHFAGRLALARPTPSVT